MKGQEKKHTLARYTGITLGRWKLISCFKEHQNDCVLFNVEGREDLVLKLSEHNVNTEIEAFYDLHDRGVLDNFPVFQTGVALEDMSGPTGLAEAPAYYIMRKMDGDFWSLDPRILETNLARIGKQLILQLQHLHNAYLLHTDVKVNNLLWRKDGEEILASLADLGLASSVEAGCVEPVGIDHFVINCGAKSLFHTFTPLMDLYGVGLALARCLMKRKVPDMCYCDQNNLLFDTEITLFSFQEAKSNISPLLHKYFELLEEQEWEGVKDDDFYKDLIQSLQHGEAHQGTTEGTQDDSN